MHVTRKNKPLPTPCETWYQCKKCKKVLKYKERKSDDHQCGEWKCNICERYHVGEHWCYHRATDREASSKKFLFYDFETRQDQRRECDEGYSVSEQRCDLCRIKSESCNSCRTCVRCRQPCCGLFQHVVNFAVLHSSCWQCQEQELKPDSKCQNCGNRCPICSTKDKRKKYVNAPCQTTCGFREHVFRGDDTANRFCTHILQEHYKDSILIAHNAKTFDLYPILEVLINNHVIRSDKIIYNGTKVMYMHISKKLNLPFVDCLNFIPMKLSDMPRAFGLEEMCKGFFPHYFNRKENQEYKGTYPDIRYYGCDYMSPKERIKFME